MNVPKDLTVDLRGGLLRLWSGDRVVVLDVGGRHGIFANGPLKWSDVVFRHLGPALAQFEPQGCPRNDDREGARPVAPPENSLLLGPEHPDAIAFEEAMREGRFTIAPQVRASGDRQLGTEAAPASAAGAPLRDVFTADVPAKTGALAPRIFRAYSMDFENARIEIGAAVTMRWPRRYAEPDEHDFDRFADDGGPAR